MFIIRKIITNTWTTFMVTSSRTSNTTVNCIVQHNYIQQINASNEYFRIRIVFKWIIRAFSGHLPPDELLILWDLVRNDFFIQLFTKINTRSFFSLDTWIWQLGNCSFSRYNNIEFSKGKFTSSQFNRKYRSSSSRFVINQGLTTHSTDIVTQKLVTV